MKTRTFAVGLAALALLLGSCGSDAPSQPTPPVVSVTPTPTPAPTPTPLGNAPVSVTMRLFGYTRNEGTGQGRFPIPPLPAYFQKADWIDLDCTPRDADGRPTNNHPPFAEWFPSSGGAGVLIEDYDYVFEAGATYTPQIQIRYLARTGYLDVHCKIPNTNLRSPTVRIEVFGGIK